MKTTSNLLLLVILLSSSALYSQNWSWAKKGAGANNENGNGICSDNAGNVIITGNFSSPSINFNGSILNNAFTGADDIFTVKYDPSGNVVWARQAGGTSYDNGYAVATDLSGNIYVTGYFQSTKLIAGTDTLTYKGGTGNDIFILKYSPSGTLLWARSAGGGKSDDGLGVSADASGNVYVTGSFQSPSLIFGTDTLFNASSTSNDIFIAKYSSSGTPLWARRAGGASGEGANGASCDPSGNVFITGFFQSPSFTMGSFTLNNTGTDYQIFTAKYNSSGTVVWAKALGGTLYDAGNGISTDGSGNAFVTGVFQSDTLKFGTAKLVNASTASYDVFILKYDPSGNPVWGKSYGGAGSESGMGVCTAITGNVFFAGHFTSTSFMVGSTNLVNASTGGENDVFIVELAGGSANPLWAVRAGAVQFDYGQGITASPAGYVSMIGSFQDNAITFGSTTLTNTNPGSSDVFTATLFSSPDGMNEEDPASLIHIYPNPSVGIFNLELRTTAHTLQAFNAMGQLILSKQSLSQGNVQIDLSAQSKGIYFLQIETEKGVVTRKLLLEK